MDSLFLLVLVALTSLTPLFGNMRVIGRLLFRQLLKRNRLPTTYFGYDVHSESHWPTCLPPSF